MKKPLIVVIAISLFARLAFFFSYHELWWDSAVYIGMGKFIFSGGQLGLWEHLRPLMWPSFIGFLWKLGFNPVIAGRVFFSSI